MTIAEALIEEGKAIGMEIGKRLGIIQAKQEDLVLLLLSRFSSFPQDSIEKIGAIHRAEELNELFDLAITAKTAGEVEIKLAKTPTGY